jgi:hypothetical protein
MSTRDAYVNKMKAKLEEWDADIAKLGARSRGVAAGAQIKYNEL